MIVVSSISDSPARAKDIAKRIRNQLLHAPKARPWEPSLTGEGGMGSLDYLCTDNELLSLCKFAVSRKLWADSSLVEMGGR